MKILKKHKLFRKFLISYLIVMIIGLVMGIIAYVIATDIVKDEITKAHHNSLYQFQNVSDNYFSSLDNTYIQIGFDPVLDMLLGFENFKNPDDLLFLADVEKSLKNQCFTNPIIKEMYLYFSNSGVIISSKGRHKEDVFLEYVFDYDRQVFLDWINTDKGSIDIFEERHSADESTNQIAYIKNLPIGRRNNYFGKMIIVIDDKILLDTLDRLEWANQGDSFVINSLDQIFLNRSSAPMQYELTYDSLLESSIIDEVVVSHVPSNIYDWKYVSVIPKSMFFARLERMKMWIIIAMLSVLVGGSIISYYFSKKNFTPVDKMIGFIQEKLNQPKTLEQDEYRFIENIISETMTEKQLYLENKHKMRQQLQESFMTQLVKGKLANQMIEEIRVAGTINVDDGSDYITVILWLDETTMRESVELLADADDTDKSSETAQMILAMTLERLLSTEFYLTFFTIDDSVIYLINIGDKDKKSAEDEIKRKVREFINMIKSTLTISFFAAVSGAYKGYNGIQRGYDEADRIIEYHLLVGVEQDQLIDYLKFEQPQMLSHYFKTDLKQLSQRIINQDIAGSKEISKKLFKDWLSSGTMPAVVIRYRMNAITTTIIQSIEQLRVTYTDSFIDYMYELNLLMSCSSVRMLQTKVEMLFENLAKVIEVKKNSEPDITQKTLKYINTNYQDTSLNISAVANEFNVNIPYLSRSFKKGVGMGPLEYMQLVRIEAAKKHLTESDISIKKISQDVGFAYEVSFIRVFKKYEGVTPGSFRKSQRQNS